LRIGKGAMFEKRGKGTDSKMQVKPISIRRLKKTFLGKDVTVDIKQTGELPERVFGQN